jgi:hypothetical protein
MSGYVVRLNKIRSTWYWFCQFPEGGGFGSNHCGSKRVALSKALRGIPAGTVYELIVNDKSSTETIGGE